MEPLFGGLVVGFTGTRRGMTANQLVAVAELLDKLAPTTVHHGDAVGADAEFDYMAKCRKIRRIAHPSNKKSQRSGCDCEVVHDEKAPLARNRDIVDHCQHLIAAPGSMTVRMRSGTWATVRYATGKTEVTVVYPNGQVVVKRRPR